MLQLTIFHPLEGIHKRLVINLLAGTDQHQRRMVARQFRDDNDSEYLIGGVQGEV